MMRIDRRELLRQVGGAGLDLPLLGMTPKMLVGTGRFELPTP